ERKSISVFICPQDPTADQKTGRLSYVVHAGFLPRSLYHGDPRELHGLGFLNWDGNDLSGEDHDVRVSAATGVFWRRNASFQPTLDDVSNGDGVSSTLML